MKHHLLLLLGGLLCFAGLTPAASAAATDRVVHLTHRHRIWVRGHYVYPRHRHRYWVPGHYRYY